MFQSVGKILDLTIELKASEQYFFCGAISYDAQNIFDPHTRVSFLKNCPQQALFKEKKCV